MNKCQMENILSKLKKCQEIIDDLNDSLIDVLDEMENSVTYEELEELRDFCNQLTKWSDFTEAKLILENLPLDKEADCNE